jgi:hypothetical protein
MGGNQMDGLDDEQMKMQANRDASVQMFVYYRITDVSSMPHYGTLDG